MNCMQEYGVRMSSVWPPSCQIHQTGTAHWIESVQVIIFDSSQGSSPRFSRSLEMQLFAIYGKAKRHLQVLQQHNVGDCGKYSIVFAEFVFNHCARLKLVDFDRPKMRDHLFGMFSKQGFDSIPETNQVNVTVIQYRSIHRLQ